MGIKPFPPNTFKFVNFVLAPKVYTDTAINNYDDVNEWLKLICRSSSFRAEDDDMLFNDRPRQPVKRKTT